MNGLINSLIIMGLGMGGIFIVILVIVFLIIALNKIFAVKK
jgi:hypothetical protein